MLATSFDIDTLASPALLKQANHGRSVLGADGRFVLPRGVRRAWIDVGAHLMEETGPDLDGSEDLAVIAIEPLEECWKVWRNSPRLIALPVAISIERGWMDFNVNAADVTSSLVKSAETGPLSQATRTIEVRKVPVLRLVDVLERIPPEIDIEYLKTDVQGLDLQVLKSAEKHLRRVNKVQTEVINAKIYEGEGELRQGTEEEFVAYMDSLGFRFDEDIGVRPARSWLDKMFVNRQRDGWFVRARLRLRSLFK